MNKINLILKNPIRLFSLITLLLSLILLFTTQFHFPDYYTNKELAQNIAQNLSPKEVYSATKHLINQKYLIYNILFHIWGCFCCLLIFSLIFKIKEFKNFKELTILNKKPFVYLWINLSYIPFCFCYVSACMINIEKLVYTSGSDSIGIPFFTLISVLSFSGFVYYFIANILAFITYNTKIKRKIYYVIWCLSFLPLIVLALDSSIWKFSMYHIFIDFYYIMWFIFVIYSIGYIKNKEK